MSTVTLTVKDSKITVAAPYHPDFVEQARGLNGKFDRASDVWTFDARDLERVRKRLLEVYGEDGSGAPVERATIHVDVSALCATYSAVGELWVGGRQICRRPGRDAGVRLGDGVIVVEGDFAPRGGSSKSPHLAPDPGTILEVRDVPRTLAVREAQETQGRRYNAERRDYDRVPAVTLVAEVPDAGPDVGPDACPPVAVLWHPALPEHWVLREGGADYLVPNIAGGWAQRRPYQGQQEGLEPLRPAGAERLILQHLGAGPGRE